MKLKKLRAVSGIAVAWGIAWALAGMVVYVALRLTGLVTENTSFVNMVGMGIRVGVAGAVVSTVFSLVISGIYRGRRLADLNWLRFGLGGATVATAFVLGSMFLTRFLSGEPVLLPQDWLLDGAMAAGFGGIAAAGSLRLAQSAEKRVGAGDIHKSIDER